MQESQNLAGKQFLIEKLQRIPFLGSMQGKYIKQILRLSRIRTYEDQELITPEGAYDQWVYILLSGAVRVLKNEEEIARLDQTGDTFGEVAAIDGKARSASVQSLGPTVCLAIDTSFLHEKNEPFDQAVFVSILYRLFAEIIAQRLRDANEELVRLRAEVENLKNNPRSV